MPDGTTVLQGFEGDSLIDWIGYNRCVTEDSPHINHIISGWVGKTCGRQVRALGTGTNAFPQNAHAINATHASSRITTLARPQMTSMKKARARARWTPERSHLGSGDIWHEQVMTPRRMKLRHMHAHCIQYVTAE